MTVTFVQIVTHLPEFDDVEYRVNASDFYQRSQQKALTDLLFKLPDD
ncbi:MAG: hypothetical protein KC443_04150 [Anaerolineales bacterium]|nr:hypothetical protein [Anaerolineales bacterium]